MAGTAYRSAIPLHRDRALFGVEPKDAPLANGEGVMWTDPNPAAPKIWFKMKDANGAIRTASIAAT
jgi:hypothetical protein